MYEMIILFIVRNIPCLFIISLRINITFRIFKICCMLNKYNFYCRKCMYGRRILLQEVKFNYNIISKILNKVKIQ